MSRATNNVSEKNSVHLDVLLSFNAFATVMQVFKRFPLLHPLQYLAAPIAKLKALSAMEAAVRNGLLRRIDCRRDTEHVDLFDYVLPDDCPVPTDGQELIHIGSLAQQMMFANYGPMSDWYYGTLLFLLEEPECLQRLSKEIRETIESYQDIMPSSLNSLPFLHACLEESLRLLPSNNTGLPRLSPGTTIDGYHVPKGVSSTPSYFGGGGGGGAIIDPSANIYRRRQTHVQTSIFALTRSARFYHDPLRYRPQRWLPPSHPLYDVAFEKDSLKAFRPFSLGPRSCIGREMAWMQGKLFVAKVLWMFDVVVVPGQRFDLERTLLHYGFLAKPELRVRFMPVAKKE